MISKSSMNCSPVFEEKKQIKVFSDNWSIKPISKATLEQLEKERWNHEFFCQGFLKLYFGEGNSTYCHPSSLGMISSLDYVKQAKIFNKLDKRKNLLNLLKRNGLNSADLQETELSLIRNKTKITRFLEQKFNNVSLNNCQTRVVHSSSSENIRAFVMIIDFEATIVSNFFEESISIF